MENINNTASLASFVSPNMAAPFEVTSRVLMSKAAGDAPLFNLMEKEVFVDIKNFEGLYQISTHGRVLSRDPRKRPGSCQYRGVSFRKDTKKWTAYIKVKPTLIRLGCFSTAELAAKARDNYIIENKLFEYKLNF